MAVNTRKKRASATQMPWMVLQPLADATIGRYDRPHTTGVYAGLFIYAPYYDCTHCFYTITMNVGDLGEDSGVCNCDGYGGVHTVTRETDSCFWEYHHPTGWYSYLEEDAYGWKFTIYASDGTVCARWRLPTYAEPNCPVSDQWYWSGGSCEKGTLETVNQTENPPVDPPEWYPVGLRLGVYRMRRKWA